MLILAVAAERFPLFTRGMDIAVGAVDIGAATADPDPFDLELTSPDGVV